jgi:hypothetical protein
MAKAARFRKNLQFSGMGLFVYQLTEAGRGDVVGVHLHMCESGGTLYSVNTAHGLLRSLPRSRESQSASYPFGCSAQLLIRRK